MKERHRDGGRPWKIGLALLVGLFLVAMATSLVLASRRVSRVVDADYYQHGLHYGEKMSAAAKR
jgi:hypothetical protein